MPPYKLYSKKQPINPLASFFHAIQTVKKGAITIVVKNMANSFRLIRFSVSILGPQKSYSFFPRIIQEPIERKKNKILYLILV